jgi:hypothetical protein
VRASHLGHAVAFPRCCNVVVVVVIVVVVVVSSKPALQRPSRFNYRALQKNKRNISRSVQAPAILRLSSSSTGKRLDFPAFLLAGGNARYSHGRRGSNALIIINPGTREEYSARRNERAIITWGGGEKAALNSKARATIRIRMNLIARDRDRGKERILSARAEMSMARLENCGRFIAIKRPPD